MATSRDGNEPASLGGAIRAARRRRRLTQTELADKLGVSYRQVLRYERGDARTPSPDLARALKKTLGIDVDEYAPDLPDEETMVRDLDRQRREIRRLRSDLQTLTEIVADLTRDRR